MRAPAKDRSGGVRFRVCGDVDEKNRVVEGEFREARADGDEGLPEMVVLVQEVAGHDDRLAPLTFDDELDDRARGELARGQVDLTDRREGLALLCRLPKDLPDFVVVGHEKSPFLVVGELITNKI